MSSAQQLDPLVYVVRLQRVVAHREVERHAARAQDVVRHQTLLELPGNLADVFQHWVAFMTRGNAGTATDISETR